MPVDNSAFGHGAAGLGGGNSGKPFVFDPGYLAGGSGGTPFNFDTNFLSGAPQNDPSNPDATPSNPTAESPSGGRWFPADAGDGLSIDIDGTINFPGLRDARQTYFIDWDQDDPKEVDGHLVAGDFKKIYLLPVDMRMTVAIPCDHRITKAVRLSVDPRSDVPLVADVANDADRIATGVRRTYFVDAGNLHRKEIRNGGWPIPACIPGINNTTFRNGNLVDDSRLLENHVRKKAREFCRLDKAEVLSTPHILSSVHAGDMISQLQNGFPIHACVEGVHFFYTQEGGGQRMERHCG